MQDLIKNKINQLLSEILLYQDGFNKLMPSDPSFILKNKSLIESITSQRGIDLIFNQLATGNGKGPFIQLTDGSIKYNLISCMGINILGHSHPLTIRSHLEASVNDSIISGNLIPHKLTANLSDKLINSIPQSSLKHFWPAISGSDANDNALKIIWQKMYPKKRIIAFKQSFCGRTVACQNLTYNSKYKESLPKYLEVDYIDHFDQKNPQTSTDKTINQLNELYNRNGDQYCALMLETIQGEAGFIYGNTQFYQEIAKWCKRKGIIFWIDEIQTFARTKKLFNLQMFELDKYVDIVTIGKALQCCGTLYSKELNPRPGILGGTFSTSTSALIFATKFLDYITSGNFYNETGYISNIEQKFKNNFEKLSSKNSIISSYGGLGTMIFFEVCDSSYKKTYDFIHQLFKNGIISFMAGQNPARIRFLLPLAIDDDHIKEIFSIINFTAKNYK